MQPQPFEIRTEWDVGFRLIIDGRETWYPNFFVAADCARLLCARMNAFDRAYTRELDTSLAFDGSRYRVELRDTGAASPPLSSFAEAEVWLDAELLRDPAGPRGGAGRLRTGGSRP